MFGTLRLLRRLIVYSATYTIYDSVILMVLPAPQLAADLHSGRILFYFFRITGLSYQDALAIVNIDRGFMRFSSGKMSEPLIYCFQKTKPMN
jgi:hypothetical protein